MQVADGIYFAICVDNVVDKETVKPGETKELLKYDTHGSITIMPTADDNGMDYTCEASHPAIPIDRPMRATITLSVFCKYSRCMYAIRTRSHNHLCHDILDTRHVIMKKSELFFYTKVRSVTEITENELTLILDLRSL